jgi:hypothetical protein
MGSGGARARGRIGSVIGAGLLLAGAASSVLGHWGFVAGGLGALVLGVDFIRARSRALEAPDRGTSGLPPTWHRWLFGGLLVVLGLLILAYAVVRWG